MQTLGNEDFERLKFIQAIRVIGMIYLIVCHCFLGSITVFYNNVADMESVRAIWHEFACIVLRWNFLSI